jgi:hypothetical protein
MHRKSGACCDLERRKLDIVHGDRRGAGANDAHDAGSRDYGKSAQNIEAAKQITGEQRDVKLPGPAAILMVTLDQGQECFQAFALQRFRDDLLVAGPGYQCKPTLGAVGGMDGSLVESF